MFECLRCAEGCDECIDSSPCIASLNWVLRSIILVLSLVIIGCLPLVVFFTWKYGHLKVILCIDKHNNMYTLYYNIVIIILLLAYIYVDFLKFSYYSKMFIYMVYLYTIEQKEMKQRNINVFKFTQMEYILMFMNYITYSGKENGRNIQIIIMILFLIYFLIWAIKISFIFLIYYFYCYLYDIMIMIHLL